MHAFTRNACGISDMQRRALRSLLVIAVTGFFTHFLFLNRLFRASPDPWQQAISQFSACLKSGRDCREEVVSKFASTTKNDEEVARLASVLDVFWSSVGSEVERTTRRADEQQRRTLEYIGKLPEAKPPVVGWIFCEN